MKTFNICGNKFSLENLASRRKKNKGRNVFKGKFEDEKSKFKFHSERKRVSNYREKGKFNANIIGTYFAQLQTNLYGKL